MKKTLDLILQTNVIVKALTTVYSALCLLALFVPSYALANVDMCYALFYPRPDVPGLHSAVVKKLNKALSTKPFLDSVSAVFAAEGIKAGSTRTLVELVTEGAHLLDTDSPSQFKSASQKTILWNRIQFQILALAQAAVLTIEPNRLKQNANYLAPLFLTLNALGFRFEKIAFYDQHNNHSTSTKSVRDVFALSANFAKKYDQREAKFIQSTPAKTIEDIPTDPINGHTVQKRNAIARKLPVELKKMLLEVYNDLQDLDGFADYSRKLMLDIAIMMKRNYEENPSENSDKIAKLRSGLLDRNTGLKVVLYRLMRWGLPLTIINDDVISDREFLKILQTGSSILDFGILKKIPHHGIATHLLQHDYLLTRFSERYGQEVALHKMQQLLAFMATDEGIGFWGDLFDNRIYGLLNNSVMFNTAISEWLNGFTK